METLDEFNANRRAAYDVHTKALKPHPNGVECPECRKELWDSDPATTLTSDPPQRDVHCPACGYSGYRLA